MSRFHERKYKRHSDPNLHKPCCFYCTPMSEEEMPSLYQPQLSLPLFSVAQHCMPFEETSNYCLCGKQCDRKKKPLSFYESQNIKKLKCLRCQEPEKLQENLELHLTETQVEEALAEDRQTALMQNLELTTTALKALAQYGQSLKVSQLAAYRLLNVSQLLTLPQPNSINSKPDSMHLTMQIQQLEIQKETILIILQDLLEHCSKHVGLPKYFNELMNSHTLKKKDFYRAAKNFKNFLSNFTLSVSQMEKLHQQYDTILHGYQQSRCMLDLELPKVINMRLVALREGFEKIKKFFNDTNDNHEILILIKSIEEKLCINDLNSATFSHVEDSSKPELCQKCKINRIDDK